MLKLILIACLLLVGCDDDGGHYQYAEHYPPTTDNETVVSPVEPTPVPNPVIPIAPIPPIPPDVVKIPEPSNRNALLWFGVSAFISYMVGQRD